MVKRGKRKAGSQPYCVEAAGGLINCCGCEAGKTTSDGILSGTGGRKEGCGQGGWVAAEAQGASQQMSLSWQRVQVSFVLAAGQQDAVHSTSTWKWLRRRSTISAVGRVGLRGSVGHGSRPALVRNAPPRTQTVDRLVKQAIGYYRLRCNHTVRQSPTGPTTNQSNDQPVQHEKHPLSPWRAKRSTTAAPWPARPAPGYLLRRLFCASRRPFDVTSTALWVWHRGTVAPADSTCTAARTFLALRTPATSMVCSCAVAPSTPRPPHCSTRPTGSFCTIRSTARTRSAL